MNQLVQLNDLDVIRQTCEKLTDDALLQGITQRHLLRCCSTEVAQEALLYYIVVERNIPIRWVIESIKRINGSRRTAVNLERERVARKKQVNLMPVFSAPPSLAG